MAGLLNVGADYQNRALSGFIRASAEQQEIDTANKELAASRKAQKSQMAVQGAVLGGFLLGGPVGAGVGYLFSQLF